MKINIDKKLEIVKKHVDEGITLEELSQFYNYDKSRIKYLCALYERHMENIFKNREDNQEYSRELKLQAIKRVMKGGEAQRQVALDIGLIDSSILRDWIALYKSKGEVAIQMTRTRNRK